MIDSLGVGVAFVVGRGPLSYARALRSGARGALAKNVPKNIIFIFLKLLTYTVDIV